MDTYPIKHSLFVLFFSVLCTGGALYAQVHVVTATEHSHFSALRGVSRDMVMINNNAYLSIGPSIDVRNTNISSRLLDDAFDESYDYYILYPIRETDIDAIRPYGRVLYTAPAFVIFKTRRSPVHDFNEFREYRVSLVTKGNVFPDFSAIGRRIGLPPVERVPDPRIQKFVDAVSDDSLWTRISALAPMERYSKNTNTKKCAEYIQNALKSYGFDEVVLQDFGSQYSPNVVAIKYGSLYKDSVFVVGGHYDVYAQGASGVDDNGSGTATTMEAARILSKGAFKTSLEFVLFSAEEVGFVGSKAYVNKLVQDKKKVGGMLNIDVALYRWDDKPEVHATYDDRSKGLFQEYFSFIKEYLPGMPTYDGYESWHKSSSDNASFWSKGFKALMTCTQLNDDHVNPLMHTESDNLSAPHYCRPALLAVTKAVVAATATWADLVSVTAIRQKRPYDGVLRAVVIKKHTEISLMLPQSMKSSAGCAMIINSKGQRIAATAFAVGSDKVGFPVTAGVSPGVYFAGVSNGIETHSSHFIIE